MGLKGAGLVAWAREVGEHAPQRAAQVVQAAQSRRESSDMRGAAAQGVLHRGKTTGFTYWRAGIGAS